MFHDTVTRFIESQKDVLNQIYSAGTAAPLEKAGKDNLSGSLVTCTIDHTLICYFRII